MEIQPLAFMVPLLHGEPQKLLGQSAGSEERGSRKSGGAQRYTGEQGCWKTPQKGRT